MNELALSMLLPLGRTTLLLVAAAAVVWMLLRAARPSSPAIHRAAWCLVLAQGWLWLRLPVAIPYDEPAACPVMTADQLSPAPAAVEPTPPPAHATRSIADLLKQWANVTPPIAPAPISPMQPAEGQRPVVFPSWWLLLAGIWLAGMVGLAGAVMVSYLRFLFCLRPTGPVEESWARQWADLLRQHRIGKAIPLQITKNVGPLLCRAPSGHLLIVPAPLWQRLTPAGRLSILRHELAHFQRGDLWKSIVVRLLALPHWFNPLAWLAVRRFDEAAEWACDEVAKGADLIGCRAYAKALLELDAACGPRPSFHAAASGRGLSVRVQRLLSPQVKEDSLMKKTTILAVALGLALLCLVRLDLVAKEPAEKDRAAISPQTQSADGQHGAQLGATLGALTGAAMGSLVGSSQPAAGNPLGSQPPVPKTAPPAADALRYMPNGCRGISWADVAEMRKINPAWLKRAFGSGFGVRTEDIDRITVGSPVWPTPHDIDGDVFFDVSHAVATIVVAPHVTALEAKKQIEKSLGSSPWREETIHGVTLHVKQSDKPIAFFQPAKQTLVIGSAKLLREVLDRDAPVQLSGKLAATWARLDQSHTIGLMMAPPAADDPVRAYLPDDLCDGIELILLEADVVAGKDVRVRLSVPCADAGVAYEVRGLCATFVKTAGNGNPLWADAAKSLQFAVNDRCFALQGRLPASVFQEKSATPVDSSPRSFLPDDVCAGIKAVRAEANMVPGKDVHFSLSIPCADANVAYEVRGLCATCCKVMGSQAAFQNPSMTEVMKTLQFTVNDRCFSMKGRLPASIFQEGAETAVSFRSFLPDDVCNGIESVRVEADMVPGKDVRLRFSVPCVDAGIANQVRGLCGTFCKMIETGFRQNPEQPNPSLAKVLESIQFTVNDRCFVLQAKMPTSIFEDSLKSATSRSQGPQTPLKTEHQQVLCELSQTYLKGFQQGLTDPANQEEAGRRLLAKARQRDAEFPRDAKLNQAQRMFRDLSEVSDQGFLQAAGWQDLDPKEKADEGRWLGQLKSDNESARTLAIYALTAMKSKKAVPGILKIAADRKEKDNGDREAACRALGIIGDLSVVPDLVHLTYHYNRDTRFSAQISLVRLTGENFGRDVAAWRQWWAKQGGKPSISAEKVAWATSPQNLPHADEKSMDADDRGILEMARKLSAAAPGGAVNSPPPVAR
jgi:beta-lactamase regulating signal transducer with metallopeptidase domain